MNKKCESKKKKIMMKCDAKEEVEKFCDDIREDVAESRAKT